ncbi:MAG: hypothetical protein WC804_21885 [Sphingomonas sp.]|jgi:hypothetical protein|uniref:hypothetical protein n=1 Tax=Sphingomonas sp. TaxID=28214 RepID=UPI0035686E8D
MRLDVRLRPTRFAYLAAPDDIDAVQRVLETNTCLWGGKYNPIVPVFSSVPEWWDRQGTSESAEQIVNGYLDYFEPDMLVETKPGQAAALGFHKDRVIPIEDLQPKFGRLDAAYISACGLQMYSLYRDLYRSEFQFSRREPEKIVRVLSEEPALEALTACIFGAFPAKGMLHDLEGVFDQVFTPEVLQLGPTNAGEIFENNWLNALHLTHAKLEVQYSRHMDPRVFVFDGTRAGDLIDYWNLRAGVAPVVPVPLQFVKELSGFARKFVTGNFRPLPGNRHGVMIRPIVMFGRSIAEESIDAIFDEHLRIEAEGANCVQPWYPRIWRTAPESMVSPRRPVITAKEVTRDAPVGGDKPGIRFDGLEPDFDAPVGALARWVNVVRFDTNRWDSDFATVYPDDYRDPKIPTFGGRRGDILSTSEGYVVLGNRSTQRHYWALESHPSAIETWLADRGIRTALSGSGRATQQIIETLGGFSWVSSLASEAVVKLLNDISRRPVNKSMEHHQFRNRVNDAVKDKLWHRDAFKVLVEKNAVELGFEVRCEKCGSWSWYALAELDAELKCHLCLRRYGFPAINPTDRDRANWAYRLIGPFAQPNYAQGGYAAALSMRFFANVLSSVTESRITWCAGQEMTLSSKQAVEADFILWYRRQELFDSPHSTQLVFGEAKSFGKDAFTADDVSRMKQLAIAFPGAALVFATMRQPSDLTEEEEVRLSELAQWGRHYEDTRSEPRAPVIILTGVELFADHSLSCSWQERGGRHAELIAPAYVRPDNLQELADMTQQLYLGMDSHHDEMIRDFERGMGSNASSNAD